MYIRVNHSKVYGCLGLEDGRAEMHRTHLPGVRHQRNNASWPGVFDTSYSKMCCWYARPIHRIDLDIFYTHHAVGSRLGNRHEKAGNQGAHTNIDGHFSRPLPAVDPKQCFLEVVRGFINSLDLKMKRLQTKCDGIRERSEIVIT